MTELIQEPAKLDVEISIGDDFSYLVDFDIGLVGYTFVGVVVKNEDQVETPLTIANIDLPAGKITISLTDAQITELGAATHKWYLTWTVGAQSRRVLAGDFYIKQYPE